MPDFLRVLRDLCGEALDACVLIQVLTRGMVVAYNFEITGRVP